MIDSPPNGSAAGFPKGFDPPRFGRWIVSESDHRWQRAIDRFGPDLMPKSLLPAIQRSDPSEVLGLLMAGESAVLLWQVDRDSLVASCDHLARTAANRPAVLQLVAAAGLSDRQRILLAEFPCAAIIRHPEDLPSLAGMVRGYFAKSLQHLVLCHD